MRFLVAGCSLCVLAAGSAFGQYVISSHSGVIQYVEGRAFLGDKPVDPKFGQFPDIKEKQEFRTEDGRAEILLTPGVFLRVGENSSIRMVSSKLTDTQVELLSGSAVIESTEIPKDNAVALIYKNNNIRLEKQGIYRIDSEPARFAVYDGQATVNDGSSQVILKGGKQTILNGAAVAENFDKKADDQDSLYRWSDRRASYVAQANVASASTAGNSYGWYNTSYNTGCGSLGFGFANSGYAPIYGGSGYTYGGAANRPTAVANRLGEIATHRGAGTLMASSAGRSSGSFGGGRAASMGGGGHAASFSGVGGGHGGGGGHR
jgi:hypothetical protein